MKFACPMEAVYAADYLATDGEQESEGVIIMARANLRQQFFRAIIGCSTLGKKKHDFKSGTEGGGSGYMPDGLPWIFSDSYKKNLKDLAIQMSNYMKENYPEIKYVGKIKARHWNAFLEFKAITCSTKTINTYYSYIGKLGLCIMQHYTMKHDLNWEKGLIKPDSLKTPAGELLRIQQMSPRDFDKIIAYSKRPGAGESKAPIAFELSRRLGLRVAECANICVKDIRLNEKGRWGFGDVKVIGKGKRLRYIDIKTGEDREYLVGVISGLKPDDKIVGIDKDSINWYLREEATKKLKIKNKYPVTGVHSIRKLYSQETFRWVQQEKGMTETEAGMYVNEQLGHSAERDFELLAVYVKDYKRKLEREKRKKKQVSTNP